MTTTQPAGTLDIGAQLADLYIVESHLLSTRSADAYRALEKNRGVPLCLWMLRHPLARRSPAVQRFADRLERIAALHPPMVDMVRYGIDASGLAFCAVAALDGHPVVSGNVEIQEAERRFVSCVRLVERLHRSGIVCGDLCGSSFWVDRSGDIRFVGLMGSFDSEAAATAMLPPAETIPFLSPEQRSAAGVDGASDVFALGVLGYFLFTGRYPYGAGPASLMTGFDLSRVEPLSRFVGAPPVWAEEVLRRCLEPDAAARYPNAGAVAEAITAVIQRVRARESAPMQVQREGSIVGSRQSTSAHSLEPMSHAPVPVETAVSPEAGRGMALRVGILGGLIILISGVTAHWYTEQRRAQEAGLRDELAVHREAANSQQLRQAIDVIGQSDSELLEQANELEKITNSDDPIAHQILVTSAKDAKTQQMRALSEKAIIDRARRLGLMRSSEQVRQWLRGLKDGDLPTVYEAVLRSLDTTLPIEARKTLLRQGYASEPKLVLKLAAALALDSASFDQYQPVLAQLIGDAARWSDASDHAALSLILAYEELALLFGDDAIQRRDQIPDKDVVWLLKILAGRGDVNVRAIANLAIERNVLPPVPAQFLMLVRDRTDLPADVLATLVRAAAGVLRSEDINPLGRWFDVDAERVLLGICAVGAPSEVMQDAFDTLAGKSLTLEPSAALVDWVRRNQWENRLSFARAVGSLAYVDTVSESELTAAFDSLDKYMKDPDLIDVLLEAKNPRISQIIVQRYAGSLGLGGLINLLSDSAKEIRIAAIKSLKDYNDIGALKIIIDRYERERDPAVREAYRENFWVIKEREGGRSQ